MVEYQTKTDSAIQPKSVMGRNIVAFLLGIMLFAAGSIMYGVLKSSQNKPAVPDNHDNPGGAILTDQNLPAVPDNPDKPAIAILTDPGVVISTDKNEYNQGETIKITVDNRMDKPLLYYPVGNNFWSIEYFKDGKWSSGVDEQDGRYQLAKGNIGEACSIIFYERPEPVELKPGSGLTGEWDQKICPLGSIHSTTDRSAIKYIKNGRYRFVFFYGFQITENDPYALSDYHYAAYSDGFTIK